VFVTVSKDMEERDGTPLERDNELLLRGRCGEKITKLQ